ncbi:MAG TPA: hypothetical protein PKC23_01125 [Candidatus Desulfobacillus sp.]|nr:hypothetical protein [Candidatus Desulfobacillus sp.]
MAMSPERARALINRVPRGGAVSEAARATSRRRRQIRFARKPAGQAREAAELLAGVEHLEVAEGPHPRGITIDYSLLDYTSKGLEAALVGIGYRLDNSPWRKLVRGLVHFVEETQLRNLTEPARLIKQSNQVFIEAYQHHPHGDHDDAPPEAREDR